MEANDIRTEWLKAGWKRGALVDLKATPCLCDVLPTNLKAAIEAKKSAFIFPILYDCALVELDFEKEPWVQVMICWECEKNNQYLYSRDPRKTHFPITIDGVETWYEITAMGIYQLERGFFLSFPPIKNAEINDNELNRLLNWVTERYRQPTFPDEFNKRLSTKDALLKRFWKKEEFYSFCSAVYFKIEPFEEIPTTDTYHVSVLVTIPYEITGKDFRTFDRDKAPSIVEKIRTALASVEGFDVGYVETVSEREFTKELERNHKRHPLEYYTYKDVDKLKVLPAEFD